MFLRMRPVAQAKVNSVGYANHTLGEEGQILANLIKEDHCRIDGCKWSDSLSR